MLYTENNEIGKIEYDEKIIGSIIKNIAFRYDGKVMLSGSKGRIKKNTVKNSNADDISFLNMKKVDDKYSIDIYVVLKFGTSIKKISHELIDKIKEEILNITGMEVETVTILITGMLSKNFSRRNIEVRG